ncbi:hypothetical protein ACHAW6_002259 [Cyclotella cf. meneghiniana]
MINSMLSRTGAKLYTFDISNFYLRTPLDSPEFVRICLNDIPEKFVNEYELTQHDCNNWVYFKIVKGVYGFPQLGILANKLLESCLNESGYYQLDMTPGLWHHKWHPILFTLIVDNFGIEYVGIRHAQHLRNVLKKHYDISENWEGNLYSGINLAWDYTKQTC